MNVLYPGHKQSSGVVAVIVPCDRWLFTESLGVSSRPQSVISAKRLAVFLALIVRTLQTQGANFAVFYLTLPKVSHNRQSDG